MAALPKPIMGAIWGRLKPVGGAGGAQPMLELGSKDVYKVGRNTDCDLVTPSCPFYSALHCTIRKSTAAGGAATYILENTGSNGTWVNEAHLNKKGQSAELADGATISLVVPASAAASKLKENAMVYKFYGESAESDAARMPPPTMGNMAPPPAKKRASGKALPAAARRNVVCRTESTMVKVLEEDYDVHSSGAPLGVGQFGKVWPCVHKRTGMEMAVKQIKKRKFMQGRSSQQSQFFKVRQTPRPPSWADRPAAP